MSDEEYIYKQARLVVLGLGMIAMLIWGLAPFRKFNDKMEKIKHNHEVHGQHFYDCKHKIKI